MQLRFFVPNEALSLPPPPLFNFPAVWMAGVFWIGALLHNGINRRPALRSGIILVTATCSIPEIPNLLGIGDWFCGEGFFCGPAGIHRQVLVATLGFCLGYYIKRYSNYYYAERDRELFSYIKHHPEDFVEREPRKIGDILEDFVPTR